MKIVNPIYDNTFKYLMDNERIAKIVLSIILDIKVVSLQSKPQETPLLVGSINMSRFDFKAVIQDEAGESKTVLIELQKYKSPNPILRFRQYLAKNYLKEETIINNKGQEKTLTLPIISIYILGYDLPEFDCKAIKVDNRPYDIVGQKQLTIKSDFVEKLTHQCFILLAIDKQNVIKRNTRLEKFLNLFIQKLQGEEANTIIEIEIDTNDDPELKEIVDYLNTATFDEDLVRKIDAEKQHYKGIETLEKQLEQERKQKEEERKQKEEAKAREEEAKAREEKERKQKEEAKAREKATILEMAKMMLEFGKPEDEIVKKTGLSIEEINQLKKSE